MPLTRECLKQKFMQFDTTGDGKLTFDEFKHHICEILKVDVSDLACHTIFDDIKKGSDDYITLEEWLNALDRKSLKDVGQKELEKTFAKFDLGGDGKITKCELKKVLADLHCKVTDKEVDDLFKEVDTSGDGYITVQEFVKAFYKEIHQE